MKQLAIILFFLFSTFNTAVATTVDQTNSAVFSFDASALGAEDLFSYSYTTSGMADDDLLGANASMLLSVGSSAGSGDIGSYVFTSPFNFPIDNVFTTGLSTANISLPATLDIFYVAVGFVDDIFSIETLTLNTSTDISLLGTNEGSVSTVPLPAAAWLFGSALLGFFGLSRRKPSA